MAQDVSENISEKSEGAVPGMWALVSLMGHEEVAGYCTFMPDGKFLSVDLPTLPARPARQERVGAAEHHIPGVKSWEALPEVIGHRMIYGSGAIYSVHPMSHTEVIGRLEERRYHPYSFDRDPVVPFVKVAYDPHGDDDMADPFCEED